jgi:hypothetical protein
METAPLLGEVPHRLHLAAGHKLGKLNPHGLSAHLASPSITWWPPPESNQAVWVTCWSKNKVIDPLASSLET